MKFRFVDQMYICPCFYYSQLMINNCLLFIKLAGKNNTNRMALKFSGYSYVNGSGIFETLARKAGIQAREKDSKPRAELQK